MNILPLIYVTNFIQGVRGGGVWGAYTLGVWHKPPFLFFLFFIFSRLKNPANNGNN